ncbi:hypothetical protein [Cohnella herbarum]|uniref:Uncharacterized protein n=1 Tax=Cohnella herbarum TaxID=2728023 RepID=A0A7Z2VJG4_9BACL|nr:hypothetical protein [Cohnella herbarum]QJD83999.1 hypothetical protein HH215_12940 [Cohnella herbarum]
MRIKYGEIAFYSKWLMNHLSLAGKQSRMRMKFIELLVVKSEELGKYHVQLLKEHCHLDEEGNPRIVEVEGEQARYDVVDSVVFERDFKELLEEEFHIEENEENLEMLLSVRQSIENCPTAWSGDQALEYEMVAKLFDQIRN